MITTTPGNLPAFRAATSELYEEWCAWAIVEELAEPDRQPELRSQLTPGGPRKLLLRTRPARLVLTLQEEMSLESGIHRPDLILRIEDSERVIILDAKYRGTGYALSRPPEDALNELHRYRDVFLLVNTKAAAKEVWTAILFPSPTRNDTEWDPERLFTSAINPAIRIGAVPLSPSLRRPLRLFLEAAGLRARSTPGGN